MTEERIGVHLPPRADPLGAMTGFQPNPAASAKSDPTGQPTGGVSSSVPDQKRRTNRSGDAQE